MLIRSGVNLTAGTFRCTRTRSKCALATRTHIFTHVEATHGCARVRRSYCLCTHRTRGCTCIYQRRRWVGGPAVTNVTVKLLFNYRREDFAYYAIFHSASETETAAVAAAGIRPKFSILFAPLTLDRCRCGIAFNLDKIALFIRREAYRKSHVDRCHCASWPRIEDNS